MGIVLLKSVPESPLINPQIGEAAFIGPVMPSIPDQLQRIGWCESGNRQFNDDGTVLRGEINPQDVGKYQINLFYHKAEAQALGFDLFTEEGNEAFALILYAREGSAPWEWSKSCWQN